MQGADATATLTTPGGSDVTICVSQIDVANDEAQHPRLFDDDYDVASATGFRVWHALSLFVALLRQPSVQAVFAGRSVLELGSGAGFLAMAVACIGAHVLATDTRTVTEESIRPNITRNCSPSHWHVISGFEVEGHRRLGAASVAAAPLDWNADARLQLSAVAVSSNFHVRYYFGGGLHLASGRRSAFCKHSAQPNTRCLPHSRPALLPESRP